MFAWPQHFIRAIFTLCREHPRVTVDSPRPGAPRRGQPAVPMAEQHELFQQVLRRNVVSRRSILRGSVSAAGHRVHDRSAQRRSVLRPRAAGRPGAGPDLPLPLRLRQGRQARLHARRDVHHGPARSPPGAVHVHRLRRPGHHRGTGHGADARQRGLPAAGVLITHHRRLLRPLGPRLLQPDLDHGACRYLAGRGAGQGRSRGSATPSTTPALGSPCWPATCVTRTRAATRSRSSTPTEPAAPSRARRTLPHRRRTAEAGTTSIPTCGRATSAPSSPVRPLRRGCSPPATTM
jgi:hypothetical protein